MKKHIVCILFHISLYVLSQDVTIDQTLNSQQLVQQVLLNNSPCAAVSNFSTVGSCGVGRFNGIGTTFPFTDGIIIRSGTVASTQGIYSNISLSTDCSGGNVGDTQLQDIGNANGLPNNIRDVSSISFDFTPTTNLFNFNFIFASNEYGEYQCDFGDVFAFILTNITAGTAPVNLAVIPGTSSPVSVTTIRNSLYNQNGANCSSVNPNLFNVFSQLNNPNSPINMRGCTIQHKA